MTYGTGESVLTKKIYLTKSKINVTENRRR